MNLSFIQKGWAVCCVYSILIVLCVVMLPSSGLAIGGSDEEPLTKINRATRQCQQTIAREGKRYAAKRAKAIGQCLNAIIKCDERRTEEKAQACRRKLINPGSGLCSNGRLDSGLPTIGDNSANLVTTFNPNATETLDRALLRFIEVVDDQCFHSSDVDLVSPDTGLGFTEDPQTAEELVDDLNSIPNGIGCVGNALLHVSYPLADTLLEEIAQFQFSCTSGPTVGSFCLNDSFCGPGGKCGKFANAISQGSVPLCIN